MSGALPVVPPAILLSPFLVFVQYHGYDLFDPRSSAVGVALTVLGLLAGTLMLWVGALVRAVIIAGLVLLFWDLQLQLAVNAPPPDPVRRGAVCLAGAWWLGHVWPACSSCVLPFVGVYGAISC